ncbi:MAG: hypothetical protein EYC68_14115 [Chloroflexota bacterium]|nr:MAG: hypothetical protein EYC68_14115 [Chloroflexota bacterium]
MDLNTIFTYFGTWTIGSLTAIDLIAATTNAFNGALLARRADHYRHWTVIGIILIAIIGGIGGGVARDVLLNDIPAALTNPWYLILCTLASILALMISFRSGQKFREGLFQFMTAFSLPWYAVVGAQKALDANLPVIAVVLIGIVGPTAGRYFIDITSGVPPKHFVKGEWFVGTAVLASILYVFLYWLGLSLWPATLITFAIAFSFRLLAQFRGWEEPEPRDTPEEMLADEKPRLKLGEAIQEELHPEEK